MKYVVVEIVNNRVQGNPQSAESWKAAQELFAKILADNAIATTQEMHDAGVYQNDDYTVEILEVSCVD